ncbi:hypothetical protein AJ80_06917 [Polytolypa hystricis UAMH7299]|uniref:F-box domain-containing protein n=1 Tax=Polytolypa hystricis (strain UAMH7299) TaxID=1447883 RepID=A0A2B7XT59_POLH7|nr:hypothetical protein AJ80_06917 [Polytolypa hystricis UAMH7299]
MASKLLLALPMTVLEDIIAITCSLERSVDLGASFDHTDLHSVTAYVVYSRARFELVHSFDYRVSRSFWDQHSRAIRYIAIGTHFHSSESSQMDSMGEQSAYLTAFLSDCAACVLTELLSLLAAENEVTTSNLPAAFAGEQTDAELPLLVEVLQNMPPLTMFQWGRSTSNRIARDHPHCYLTDSHMLALKDSHS